MSSVRYRTRLGDLKNKQSTESNSGFWKGDYGWAGYAAFLAHGMSSVRYRTRLGDLKNKQSTESLMSAG